MILNYKKFAFLAIAFLFLGCSNAMSEEPKVEKLPNVDSEQKLEAYLKFTKILGIIETYYVDDVNTTTLVNKALEGLLSNLDAHSSYMDKKSFEDLNVQTKGEFGGLGISVGMRDNVLTVIAPLQDTPADKAGVKAGDVILKLDEKATLGMSIDEAVNIMRGKPGTPIMLTVVRKGESKPLDIKITRDIIKIQSVFTKHIDGDILYIGVSSFDKKVVSGVKKALKDNPKTKGIILDLRNNPGGLLDQAVGLVDLFVNNGTIVSQKGKSSEENIVYDATVKGSDTITPIVTLINGGSASASEIVSGALQDFGRSIIVGEKTFGKGSVQIILPIDNTEEALRLTVARYYLPSGRTIQAEGVLPDIIVEPGEFTKGDDNSGLIKEKDLANHLQNSEVKNSDKKDGKKSDITENEIFKDAQLKSGIDILKAMIISSNRNQEKK
ncbi:MAG: S41 family peptidase [Campylobacterales bacterium]|nr:S41 family peptidase [Campylobacterales bacterium]